MEKPKVIVHVLTEKGNQMELIEQALENEDYDTSFIPETIETVQVSPNDLDIIVLQPTLSNWEWLDMLMSIKREHPDLPIFVYSPEIGLEQRIAPALEDKRVFLVNDLNSLREKTRAMINKTKQPKKKILLVDDDENTLNSYIRMLRKTPWEILTASNGKKALEILSEHSIQLVISDIKMPEMHGIELIAKIKANDSKLPIVVCSGFHGMKDDQNLQLHGVTDFVEKPVEPDILKSKLNEILGA